MSDTKDNHSNMLRDAFSYLKLWDMIRRYDLDHVLDLHGTMPVLQGLLQVKLAKAIQIRQYFESTPDIDPSKSQKLISKYREYAKEVIKEFAKSQGYHLRKTGNHEYRFKPLKPVVFHMEEPDVSDPNLGSGGDDVVDIDHNSDNEENHQQRTRPQRRLHIRSKPHWRKKSNHHHRRNYRDYDQDYVHSSSAPESSSPSESESESPSPTSPPSPPKRSRDFYSRKSSSRSSGSSSYHSSSSTPTSRSSGSSSHHSSRYMNGRRAHQHRPRYRHTEKSSTHRDTSRRESTHRRYKKHDRTPSPQHDRRKNDERHSGSSRHSSKHNDNDRRREHKNQRNYSQSVNPSFEEEKERFSEYHPLPTIQSLNNPDDVPHPDILPPNSSKDLLPLPQPVQPSPLSSPLLSPLSSPSQQLPPPTQPLSSSQQLPPPAQPLSSSSQLPPPSSGLTMEFNDDLPARDVQLAPQSEHPVLIAKSLRTPQEDRPSRLDRPDMNHDPTDLDAKVEGVNVSDASASVNFSERGASNPIHSVYENLVVKNPPPLPVPVGVNSVVNSVFELQSPRRSHTSELGSDFEDERKSQSPRNPNSGDPSFF